VDLGFDMDRRRPLKHGLEKGSSGHSDRPEERKIEDSYNTVFNPPYWIYDTSEVERVWKQYLYKLCHQSHVALELLSTCLHNAS